MGLCCSKPVITNPTETPSAVVRPEPIAMEQNPMIPPGRDQPGVPPVQDEITIVHVVTPDALVNVEDVIEVVAADPTDILPAVEETILVEPTEPRRDSVRPPCQIELYKETIGVIEKHPREPTAV